MISLLCPTRGRPDNVRRMVSSARDTASLQRPEVVFRTDDDDPDPVPQDVAMRSGIIVVCKPRAVLSSLWNDAAEAASGDILMQCDDEAFFHTPGWDVLVENAFAEYPDRIAFVHGNDLYQPAGTFGALGFLHRAWTDAVGYFTPPYFSCDYGDTWINDVANMLGRRRYVPDLIIEHLHPIAGKGEWDQTHRDRIARGQADGVAWQYEQMLPRRMTDAEKLRAVMA